MKKALTVAAIATTLAACGSSGDDSSTSINDYPTVTITASNSDEIATTTTLAVFDGLGTGLADMVVGVDTVERVSYHDFVNLDNILSILKKTTELEQNDSVTGVKQTEKVNCDVSGSMTLVVSLSSQDEIKSGDYIKTTMNNCDQGYGKGSGSMTMTFLRDTPEEVLLGFGNFETEMRLEFKNLTVSEGSYNAVSNGTFTLHIDNSYDGYVSSVYSDQFSMTTSNSYEQIIANFVNSTTYNANADIMIIYSKGEVADSILDGKVSFETTEPFVFNSSWDDYPVSGELTMTGVNSVLQLTALSDTEVQLELDDNADGTMDTSKSLSWYEFY
ncbi:hypothetical protein ACMZOO_08700 [Catenovulum sp. SX2]|uniref:hypothetical protein n=1 Tax=Catenovulum sp. SX2 TaxID=3398614 RepID=UPI003F8305B5